MTNTDTFSGFIYKAKIGRQLCLVMLTLLIICYGIHYASAAQNALFKLSVVLIPLATFIPGLLKRKYRSASMLCFVLLLYFISSVQNIFTPGQQLFDWTVLSLVVLLFITSMMYSRWQQRANIEEGVSQ